MVFSPKLRVLWGVPITRTVVFRGLDWGPIMFTIIITSTTTAIIAIIVIVILISLIFLITNYC